MKRKLSRKETVEKEVDYQEVLEAGLNVPGDFISEMSEAFSLFDKVNTIPNKSVLANLVFRIKMDSSALKNWELS